jgi:GMP synthase-like glutamine amidotransferase
MKPLRVFRHIACEGVGHLCAFLARRDIPYEVVCIDRGVTVPSRLDDVSGLVFMGGPGSVHDPLPWVAAELALIRRALERGTPMMGVCLGGQMIAKALGAEVRRGASMEIGWHTLERLPSAAGSPWLAGLPERFQAFHWHAWTFEVPAGATPLLRSACFENQAFAVDQALAMQFHLEVTARMIKDWSIRYCSDLAADSSCIQNAASIQHAVEARVRRLHSIGDVLYGRFLARLSGATA